MRKEKAVVNWLRLFNWQYFLSADIYVFQIKHMSVMLTRYFLS